LEQAVQVQAAVTAEVIQPVLATPLPAAAVGDLASTLVVPLALLVVLVAEVLLIAPLSLAATGHKVHQAP
tara:strand:+ start:250 stop:459 length:210 start_codon:yes stop_codon:yes gene_type:complete